MVRAPPTFTLFPYTTLFRSEKRAHRDVDDSQSATTVKDVLDSGSERQPQKATRQGGQDEEAPEGGSLHDRAPRFRAEKGAGRARRHQPRFRIDPLKDRSTQVANPVPVR